MPPNVPPSSNDDRARIAGRNSQHPLDGTKNGRWDPPREIATSMCRRADRLSPETRSLDGVAISSRTFVVFQQPTKPRLATNLVKGVNRWHRMDVVAGNQPIPDSLMRPALVIVRNELTNDVIEVGKTKHDEVIEGFVFQALDPTFDKGVHSRGQLHPIATIRVGLLG